MVDSHLAHRASPSIPFAEAAVNESPVKWCSTMLSEVVARGKRLEASVFDIEARQAWEQVTHGKYAFVLLGGDDGIMDTAYYPGRFKRIYCEKGNGVPFFLPSQMSEVYPRPEKYISTLSNCNMEELKLKADTLLLTRSGTIGTVSLVSQTTIEKIFSDDVIRITFKNKHDLGFVYAFLRSETGNLILATNGYGSVITHLEPEHLKSIPIPDAPCELKSEINELMVRSYELRDESNNLIDQATALLIHELHLPSANNFDIAYYKKQASVNTYSKQLSSLAGRLDASYHAPIVDAITTHLQNYAAEITTISDARISKDVILPGRFKRVYVDQDHGRVFIGGKQLFELDPSNKKYLSVVHHCDRISRQLELHEGMTLITCSGTIGKVALVGRHWENWTANQHIIRIVPATKDVAGYLNIFLSSDYGFKLIERFTYGSVVDEIDDNHVRQIPIPILKNQVIQQQINNLALMANEKRYEAYNLEQEALKIMNNEVIFA